MKVVIQHPSGAVYQGSNRYAVEWWERFSATHPAVVPAQSNSDDEEAPAVVGLDGNWSGPQERRFEHGEHNQFADMPIVNAKRALPFGFVRNEENAK